MSRSVIVGLGDVVVFSSVAAEEWRATPMPRQNGTHSYTTLPSPAANGVSRVTSRRTTSTTVVTTTPRATASIVSATASPRRMSRDARKPPVLFNSRAGSIKKMSNSSIS